MLKSVSTEGNKEEKMIRAQMRRCCVPFLESGRGLVLEGPILVPSARVDAIFSLEVRVSKGGQGLSKPA